MNLNPFQQMFKSNRVFAVVLLAVSPAVLFATHGGYVLSGYVDDSGEIVLVIPHENVGFSLGSRTQNLVPLPPGDLSADPSPYRFLLHNGPGFITFGSLVPEYIGGSINTGVRLTDGDVSELTGHYGGVTPELFRIFDAAPPRVTASIDVGGGLMIHGTAPELNRVLVVSERTSNLERSFTEKWFNDLPGLDGSLSLPFESDTYPVSEDFALVAIYCQGDGNCREIEFETEFACNPNTFGDLNGDHRVGFEDFLIIAFNFGKAVPDHRYGDVDCDGFVKFSDFLVNSTCFGCNTVGAQPVPEPSAEFMLMVVGLSMVHARRKANFDSVRFLRQKR